MHQPPTTLKYLSGGVLAQASLTALAMAQAGQRGSRHILDDAEFGFRRYIGSERWEPEHLLDGLGERWDFVPALSYKPYPHARGSHGAIDATLSLVEDQDLRPDEIEGIRVWGEAFAATYPVWQNKVITSGHDAQFSIPHVVALSAHRIPPGRAWQDPVNVYSPTVLRLMERTTYQAHPAYAKAVSEDVAKRPTKVEIDARGLTFTATSMYPRGSQAGGGSSPLTTDELTGKFRVNVASLLEPAAVDEAIDTILRLEAVEDIGQMLAPLRRTIEAEQEADQ
jgi:2-methylcitrate dehydratase PrpD